MSDIRTFFIGMESGADWLLQGGNLDDESGLDTAVILSLFSDARAKPGDVTPSPDDVRGWWGDDFAKEAGDRFGSRQWLLGRRKQLQDALNEARGYAEEALAWLVKDGIARRVEVNAFIPRDEWLGLAVTIYRPNGQPVRYRFEALWSSL